MLVHDGPLSGTRKERVGLRNLLAYVRCGCGTTCRLGCTCGRIAHPGARGMVTRLEPCQSAIVLPVSLAGKRPSSSIAVCKWVQGGAAVPSVSSGLVVIAGIVVLSGVTVGCSSSPSPDWFGLADDSGTTVPDDERVGRPRLCRFGRGLVRLC